MAWWTLLVLSAGLQLGRHLLVQRFARWSAATDAAQFAADTRDRYRDVFHRQRLTVRVLVLGSLAAGCWLFLWRYTAGATVVLTLAYAVLCGAEFNLEFTRRLNLARGLAEYYVSATDHAARFDRFVRRLAARADVPPERMMATVLRTSVTGGRALVGLSILVGWLM